MSEHNRGNFSNSKSQSRKSTKHKPKAWSHQDDLKHRVGKDITLLLTDNSDCTVRLLGADQFTLHVERKNGERGVIFKHALIGYFPS